MMLQATLISQGAEAKVFNTEFLGRPSVCKERQVKRYRLKELDTKINKQRLVHEARCLAKCLKFGISAPCIYFVDTENYRLYLEKIEGQTLKQHLWDNKDYSNPVNFSIADKVGKILACLHDSEIVHGDLTTSNIMLRNKSPEEVEIVLIDFGLGMMKPNADDKAVDLYVLERAFVSTHADSESMVNRILEAYASSSKKGSVVMSKLDQVRQRGRKRDMLG